MSTNLKCGVLKSIKTFVAVILGKGLVITPCYGCAAACTIGKVFDKRD